MYDNELQKRIDRDGKWFNVLFVLAVYKLTVNKAKYRSEAKLCLPILPVVAQHSTQDVSVNSTFIDLSPDEQLIENLMQSI